jgi:hypothetical protein
MQQWATNAIQLDKFEQTAAFSSSSSLFDILTSIQQQLDFVQNLKWPSRQDKELMREKMYQVLFKKLNLEASLNVWIEHLSNPGKILSIHDRPSCKRFQESSPWRTERQEEEYEEKDQIQDQNEELKKEHL